LHLPILASTLYLPPTAKCRHLEYTNECSHLLPSCSLKRSSGVNAVRNFWTVDWQWSITLILSAVTNRQRFMRRLTVDTSRENRCKRRARRLCGCARLFVLRKKQTERTRDNVWESPLALNDWMMHIARRYAFPIDAGEYAFVS